MSKEDYNTDKNQMLVQICGHSSKDSGSSNLESYVLEGGDENEIELNLSRLNNDSTGDSDNDVVLQDEIPYVTVDETVSSSLPLSDTAATHYELLLSHIFSTSNPTVLFPLDGTTRDPSVAHSPISNN